MNKRKTLYSLWPLLPCLIGLIAFIGITGGSILWPQNIDWLMDGDPATHYLGWQFFRQAPLLQWPLGASNAYGMQIGSSIVFTDSIPLMAFIFKPFSAWLPETFQYIGLWVLLCFMLQSYFAWKLLSHVTPNRWLALVGSAFFTLAPIYLSRLGMHYALVGQWVIVASLYFYLAKQFSVVRWALLLSAAALIHAYLLAMVLAVWMTDLVQRRWTRELSTVRALLVLLGCMLLVGMVMWSAGYFMLKAGVQSGGFGFYRMNALSLFDSNGTWSAWLPDLPNMPGDYEGFGFLGAGMILLGIIALILLAGKMPPRNHARFIPLAMLCVALFMYALSDHIAIGANESFQFALPDITKRITDTFRVSGRFVWPVYYALYLGIFYLIFSRTKARTALLVCCATLVLQVVDCKQAWHNLRSALHDAPTWQSPLQSAVWDDLGKHYKKLIYVLPSNQPKEWLALSAFAAQHHMAINIGYFARTNPQTEQRARDTLIEKIDKGQLEPDALYVFDNEYLWGVLKGRGTGVDLMTVRDGFRILAPGLALCQDCQPATLDAFTGGADPKFAYQSGPLSFQAGGAGVAHLLYGWGSPDTWGTWSSGRDALIRVVLQAPPKGDLQLTIKAHGLVSEKLPQQTVKLSVNGQLLGTLDYTKANPAHAQTLTIPEHLITVSKGQLRIMFRFDDAATPRSAGIADDLRVLALGIESLEIRALQ